MTSANGTPAGNFRRPSAAFPRIARGALPSGQTARTAMAARAFRVLLLAATCTVPLALTSVPALAGNTTTARQPAEASREARPASGPRLPDASQELLPPPALGGGAAAARLATGPRAACLAAARRAEQVHGLPSGLLVAIALSESGLHAHALNIGGRAYYPQDLATARQLIAQAPARRTIMAGCVQVNARVHARGSDWPLDPVRAADWAGGMLRRWYMETGTWDDALRRWHGGSPASTRRVVCRVRAKLEVTAPGSGLLQGQSCPDGETQQARRNGAALLEVAELQDP
jgi:hypothetical protein